MCIVKPMFNFISVEKDKAHQKNNEPIVVKPTDNHDGLPIQILNAHVKPTISQVQRKIQHL